MNKHLKGVAIAKTIRMITKDSCGITHSRFDVPIMLACLFIADMTQNETDHK